ncbi:hypothetical protein Aduo_002330 [Ancylostoma duodenale]
MVQRDGTHLPGSKNLFKMTYDCDLEGIAMTIVQDCPRKPDPRYVPSGKSVNYEVRRLVNDEPGSDVAYTNETKKVVAHWINYSFDDNLDTNTVRKLLNHMQTLFITKH